MAMLNNQRVPLNHWTTAWQKRCKAVESHSDVMTLTVVDPGISSSAYVKSCKITRQTPVLSNICSCDVLLLLIWGLCSCISNFVSYIIFGHTHTDAQCTSPKSNVEPKKVYRKDDFGDGHCLIVVFYVEFQDWDAQKRYWISRQIRLSHHFPMKIAMHPTSHSWGIPMMPSPRGTSSIHPMQPRATWHRPLTESQAQQASRAQWLVWIGWLDMFGSGFLCRCELCKVNGLMACV